MWVSKNITISKENTIKSYGEEYNKKILELKNKSSNYIKNNNDKDFIEIGTSLKKLKYEETVFPKQIRAQKPLKEIQNASSSFSKVNRKLKAHDIIDKEILRMKKPTNGQKEIKISDIYIKINKQSLLAKANKIAYDISSIQLPVFDDRLNNISLEKRIKKLNQKIDKLAKKIEKYSRIIASSNNNDDINVLKKIKIIRKNLDKFHGISNVLRNDRSNAGDNRDAQHTNTSTEFISNLEKGRYLVNDIDNNNNVLRILKKEGAESYVTDIINQINKELKDKQNRFIEICRQLASNSYHPMQQKVKIQH